MFQTTRALLYLLSLALGIGQPLLLQGLDSSSTHTFPCLDLRKRLSGTVYEA